MTSARTAKPIPIQSRAAKLYAMTPTGITYRSSFMLRSIMNLVMMWGCPATPMPNTKNQASAPISPMVPHGPLAARSSAATIRLISAIPPSNVPSTATKTKTEATTMMAPWITSV